MSSQKVLRYTDTQSDVDWLVMIIVVAAFAVVTSLFQGQPGNDQLLADHESGTTTLTVEQSR